MRPLYIFDIDGTLALNEHRKHHIKGPKKDWRAFYDACPMDLPNWPVIHTLQAILADGAEIWFFTGRDELTRVATEEWLKMNVLQGQAIVLLRMRPVANYTPDDVMKEQWLAGMSGHDRSRLIATFDDRDKVVSMWRRNGVTCYQVAPGDF